MAIGIFSFHLRGVIPYWGIVKDKPKINSQQTIDIFYANLNSQNSKKHLLIEYLKDAKPDFVMLVEFNSHWAAEIIKLKPIYPYTKAIIREGNFGMAILSKTELEVSNVYVDRENMIPSLILKTNHATSSVNLVLLHTFPPISKYATILRDQYLTTISRAINDLTGPTLVCGDFNTTPWTYIYQQFIQSSGLHSDDQHIIPNTWPTTFLLPSLPIDHCLSKKISFLKYDKGPNIGSDHWPLQVKMAIHQDEM